MAIDYGSKNIGLAISDELRLTVRPLTTIRCEGQKRKHIVENIRSLAAENQVVTIVIGLPLNMDGSRGAAAERVEKFIADLQTGIPIPIITVDERLTSYEADQILREMGVSQKERKAKSDEYSAVLILRIISMACRADAYLIPIRLNFK